MQDIVRWYTVDKLSAKRIARRITEQYQKPCNKQTILQTLRDAGIPRRSRKEFSRLQQKYPRKPFDGDLGEKLYYQAYHTGDLCLYHLSAFSIIITLGTTVPASIQLFKELFDRYGKVKIYPERNKLIRGYRWRLKVILERPSFDFLVEKVKRLPEEAQGEDLYKFFAGYVDAEGCLAITHDCDHIRYRIDLGSQDLALLEGIQVALKHDGFTSGLRLQVEAPKEEERNGVTLKTNKDIYQLSICGNPKVLEILKRLPIRHRHKVLNKQLMLRLWNQNRRSWNEVKRQVFALRRRIDEDVEHCVRQAGAEYLRRHRRTAGSSRTPSLFPPP